MRIAMNKGLLKLQGRFYVVQFSDSLYLISQRFGISVSDLLTYNDQLQGTSTIFPGEVLYIPEPMSTTLRKGSNKHKSKHSGKHVSGKDHSKHQSTKKRLSRP